MKGSNEKDSTLKYGLGSCILLGHVHVGFSVILWFSSIRIVSCEEKKLLNILLPGNVRVTALCNAGTDVFLALKLCSHIFH